MQNEVYLLRPREEAAQKGESTISDMARLFGVSLRTLRFYEDKGLLHPRRQGTARFYGAADRIRLELILKGKRLGFTLAEIHELIDSRTRRGLAGSPEDESSDLTVSLDRQQLSSQIVHLERRRQDLDIAIDELRRAYERITEEVG